MSSESSYDIVNRLNIDAVKEVVKAEREHTREAKKMAQDAINANQMLRAEVEQLKSLVNSILTRVI